MGSLHEEPEPYELKYRPHDTFCHAMADITQDYESLNTWRICCSERILFHLSHKCIGQDEISDKKSVLFDCAKCQTGIDISSELGVELLEVKQCRCSRPTRPGYELCEVCYGKSRAKRQRRKEMGNE